MPTRNNKPRRTLAEIVVDCQRPEYELYEFKRGNADWIRSYQIGQLFSGRDIIAADEVAAVLKEFYDTDYSMEFEAKRGGDLIRWAVDNGVITPVAGANPPAWQITDDERQPLYEEIGSHGHRRNIRMRRWRTADEEKAYRRQLKRWEQDRIKRVAASKVIIERQLAEIFARDVEVQARGALQQYTTPGATKLVEIQNYVLQQLDGMSLPEVWAIEHGLAREYAEILALPLALEPAPEISDEDLDILDHL